MKSRANEPPKTHFRSANRCFKTDDEWYFATRESIDVGPYPTRDAADLASVRLAKMLDGVTDPLAVRKIIREFMFLKVGNVRMP